MDDGDHPDHSWVMAMATRPSPKKGDIKLFVALYNLELEILILSKNIF